MKILCITPTHHIMGVNDLLKHYGDVEFRFNMTKNALINRLKEGDVDAIFTNPNKQGYVIDSDVLEGSGISVICTASTGTNHIDVDYCASKGIKVLSLTRRLDVIERITSTAEHAFALMLALIRKIPDADYHTHGFGWDYQKFIGRQLDHMTIGIVGYGRLGTMMVKYCEAFGMKVLVYDPFVISRNSVPFERLVSDSDIISLHVHLNDETREMIYHVVLEKMKAGSYLINTSRGDIVNEQDVLESLRAGHLAGYATDVISDELDDVEKSELLNAKSDLNIIVTPHIGGMTVEAQEIAYNAAAQMLLGWINDRNNR